MDARQRAKIAQRSKRAPLVRVRRTGNPYRFSPIFIRRMTAILCIAIVVIPSAGIIYGLTLGSDYEPWQGAIATGLLIGGFVVPLLAASVLGGEAIRRGAGSSGSCSPRGSSPGPRGRPWASCGSQLSGTSRSGSESCCSS